MSANGDDSGPGRREVAHRVFATEFDAASLEYSSSDEERAPKYVITPTGARVNRLFVVGVLTEVEPINDDVVRARIADPTGAFVVYAGQYQPEALAFLERTEPPAFVAVTGKANTFQPDGSDRVFTSIRPESVNEVDVETRDRWTVQAAEHTLDRVSAYARALGLLDGQEPEDVEAALANAGFDETEASGIALAYDHYGTTPAYLSALRETALDAARLVAGEVDAVEAPTIAPDEAGADVALKDLRLDAEATVGQSASTADEPASATEEAEPVSATAPESGESTAEAVESEATSGADDLEDFEPVAEPGSEPTDEFESTETVEESAEAGEPAETAETEDVGMYELDDEERAEVEEEFGTEFSTGAEVNEPGESGIDVPDASEELDEGDADVEDGTEAEDASEAAAPEAVEEPEAAETEAEGEGPADVDVEDAAMEAMRDLADGDGADHDAVVARVVDEHGVEPEAVEDAIQDALMSGRCYEPQDGVLKPI